MAKCRGVGPGKQAWSLGLDRGVLYFGSRKHKTHPEHNLPAHDNVPG